MEAPLKDIVTIASHDGEPLSLKEKATPHFDIESGYIKGVNVSLIRLPAKKNHIKLLSGRFPHQTNEVIITNNLSHKLKSQFTCHLLEDDTYKVVGVIEDNFYQDQFICFHHDIDKKYPDLIRDDKMDIITNNPKTVIKRYENNYEADELWHAYFYWSHYCLGLYDAQFICGDRTHKNSLLFSLLRKKPLISFENLYGCNIQTITA